MQQQQQQKQQQQHIKTRKKIISCFLVWRSAVGDVVSIKSVMPYVRPLTMNGTHFALHKNAAQEKIKEKKENQIVLPKSYYSKWWHEK